MTDLRLALIAFVSSSFPSSPSVIWIAAGGSQGRSRSLSVGP